MTGGAIVAVHCIILYRRDSIPSMHVTLTNYPHTQALRL